MVSLNSWACFLLWLYDFEAVGQRIHTDYLLFICLSLTWGQDIRVRYIFQRQDILKLRKFQIISYLSLKLGKKSLLKILMHWAASQPHRYKMICQGLRLCTFDLTSVRHFVELISKNTSVHKNPWCERFLRQGKKFATVFRISNVREISQFSSLSLSSSGPRGANFGNAGFPGPLCEFQKSHGWARDDFHVGRGKEGRGGERKLALRPMASGMERSFWRFVGSSVRPLRLSGLWLLPLFRSQPVMRNFPTGSFSSSPRSRMHLLLRNRKYIERYLCSTITFRT